MDNIFENYETKDGKELEFKWIESTDEVSVNQGWIVHELKAFLDGDEVGYIKASYIPEERFEKVFPTVFHYLSNVRGKLILNRGDGKSVGSNRDEFPDDIKDFAESLHQYARGEMRTHPDYPAYGDEVSEEKWAEIAEYYVEKYKERYGDDYSRFREWYVNKPYVDYINVKREYRRRGIGFQLYKRMAEILGERGMVLYASSLQSEEAQAAWEKLKEVLPVKTTTEETDYGEKKKRYYIDFR